MDQNKVLREALSHHQENRLEKARAGYISVLEFEPENINALHLLGVLKNQMGQHDDAIYLICRALEIQPIFAEAENSLGNVYKELENWSEAEAAYRRAIKINPQFAGAYLNLSVATRKRGDLIATLEACDKAIAIDPSFAPAQFNKANALREMKRPSDAVAIYREILNQDAHYTDAQQNLGITLQDLGNRHLQSSRWEIAITMYSEAIAMGIDNAPLHNNLGSALKATGRIHEAIEAFGSALKCDPEYAAAYNNMGTIFEELGEPEKALKSYRRALECDTEFIAALNNIGNTLRSLDRVNEAVDAYQSALSIDPNFLDAQFNLGHAYKEIGKFEEAAHFYNNVLDVVSDHPGALRQLASLGKLKDRAGDIPRLRAAISDNMPDKDRAELAFALAKFYEDYGRIDEMFELLAIGNAAKRRSFNYNPVTEGRWFQSISDAFSIERQSASGGGYHDDSLIFIVGLPRSGTSLVEQILASHPEIFGAGELMTITNLAENTGFPEKAASLSPREQTKLGKTYMEQIRARSKNAPRITDKMPQNFLYLGFIRMILPNAKIIHCTRSPEDTCLSLYKTLFTDRLDFAYDLAELGSYFTHYANLMEHWRTVIPGGFLDFSYEALITNQEHETHRLLDYLALPWDDACMHFHKTARRIATASATQVRQKLYTGSMGSGRKHAAYLSPLIDAMPSAYRSKIST